MNWDVSTREVVVGGYCRRPRGTVAPRPLLSSCDGLGTPVVVRHGRKRPVAGANTLSKSVRIENQMSAESIPRKRAKSQAALVVFASARSTVHTRKPRELPVMAKTREV